MTGSRRRTTMSATEALAFLRSLPTADDRALAARPLLDLLQAPGNTAVGGWSILIQLIRALEPDLPLRTILDIGRSQETRANGDITGDDLDSLASLSPMLQEPFIALCTPIRSPTADGALLRLHLPAWIFRTSANDSTCPPPGIPLRIIRTSAGPRLDFSEAVRPGPFGHWGYSISRMNWPMRRAPDALRGRLLRHVRQPLPASFFPDVLHDIASRAALLLEALAALFPPGTLFALRRLREANIHALAAMAPPDPEAARRRAQFMRAHPAHAALILHSHHPEHRGSGPYSFMPIPSLGETLEWIDRNLDPGQIVRGLTGARTILPTSRPLRRSRANLVAELDILHLCSASPRCIPQRLRSLPGNIWFCAGSSPRADHLPDNHFAAAAAEAWAQDPRLRDERIRSPRRHLDRLCRAVCHARLLVQPPEFPPPPVRRVGFRNPTAFLPPRTLIRSLAAGAQDAPAEDPSHLRDAAAAWISDCLVPQIGPEHLRAISLACHDCIAPGSLAAFVAFAVSCWLHAPFAEPGSQPKDPFLRAPPDLLLPPGALNRWTRNWHQAMTRPCADGRLTRFHDFYPALPASLRLPPGATHILSSKSLVRLGDRQKHCIASYDPEFLCCRAFCFAILHNGCETTLTVTNPKPGAPRAGMCIEQHSGYRNRRPPPQHDAIAADILRALRNARRDHPEHFPQPRPAADWPQPAAALPDPELAWARIHRACVPEALHALRPGTGLLPRLLEEFVPL